MTVGHTRLFYTVYTPDLRKEIGEVGVLYDCMRDESIFSIQLTKETGGNRATSTNVTAEQTEPKHYPWSCPRLENAIKAETSERVPAQKREDAMKKEIQFSDDTN